MGNNLLAKVNGSRVMIVAAPCCRIMGRRIVGRAVGGGACATMLRLLMMMRRMLMMMGVSTNVTMVLGVPRFFDPVTGMVVRETHPLSHEGKHQKNGNEPAKHLGLLFEEIEFLRVEA